MAQKRNWHDLEPEQRRAIRDLIISAAQQEFAPTAVVPLWYDDTMANTVTLAVLTESGDAESDSKRIESLCSELERSFPFIEQVPICAFVFCVAAKHEFINGTRYSAEF